jgi:hypothetical protein
LTIGIVAVLICVACAGVDFLIIRHVWRMVNKPVDYAETERLRSHGRQALFQSGLSGILGIAALCFWPHPPDALVWMIPVTALLGIIFGILARKHRLGKQAIAIGAVSLGIWLTILAAVNFPSKNPFYVGQAYFLDGDSIEITSVERTENQMTVRGHYHLASHDSAWLVLKTDASGPIESKEQMPIFKGNGDFELTDSHVVPGLPHMGMYQAGSSTPFALIYFGNKAEAAEESTMHLSPPANTIPHPGFSERLQAIIKPAATAAATTPLSFGPVVERLVTNSLNFSTGNLGGLPWFDHTRIGRSPDVGVLDQKETLLRKQKVDLFTDDPGTVYGVDLKAMAVDSEVWDAETTPEKLADNLALTNRANLFALAFHALQEPSRFQPATYLFETRDGRQGILQITGFTDNPRGVKVRYKLVQPEPIQSSAAVDTNSATPVDLTAYYTTPASSFDTINGFPAWKSVPRGFQVFDHVPLQIGGMICLWGGGNATKLHIIFPEQVPGIELNRKFETLYVYHGAFFKSPDGTPVCEVVFRYEDGSSIIKYLRYGDDMLDWIAQSNVEGVIGPTGPNSRLAWVNGSFTPGKIRPLRLCLTSLDNPKPHLRVTAIDLYSCKSWTAPCIMAMTTGRSGLMP